MQLMNSEFCWSFEFGARGPSSGILMLDILPIPLSLIYCRLKRHQDGAFRKAAPGQTERSSTPECSQCMLVYSERLLTGLDGQCKLPRFKMKARRKTLLPSIPTKADRSNWRRIPV